VSGALGLVVGEELMRLILDGEVGCSTMFNSVSHPWSAP